MQAGSRWPWVEFRRVAAIRRQPNCHSDKTLLALSAASGIQPRPDDGGRQLPSRDTISKYWTVFEGDLVFNPMWAIEGGVAVSELKGAVSTAYRVYHLSRYLFPRYGHYYFRSDPALAQYRLMVRGITTFDRSITRADFEAMPMPLPPLRAQESIANYLEIETGVIDSLIFKKICMLKLLQQHWRAMVEYRMQSLISLHGTIALKRLIQCLDGQRVPLSAEERSSRSGPYPYYGASGIIDSVDSYLFDETLVLLGEDGAQLADPDYDISFVVRGKVWVNNHAHVLRPVAADPYFLSMHLTTLDRGAFISGATREKITQADMNEIPVPNVSVSIQSEIARELSSARARCEKAITAISRQIDILSERRQALITAAVTGELAVPGVAA